MKNFLVTGAAGFIGSKILKSLIKNGYKADGLDNFYFSSNKNYNDLKKNIINCDITKKIELKSLIKKYDTIVHLAAVDNRKYFVEQIKNAMAMEAKNKMSSGFIHHLKEKRDKLSAYSSMLHTVDKKFGKTPFWVIGNLVKNRKVGFIKDIPVKTKSYDYNLLYSRLYYS